MKICLTHFDPFPSTRYLNLCCALHNLNDFFYLIKTFMRDVLRYLYTLSERIVQISCCLNIGPFYGFGKKTFSPFGSLKKFVCNNTTMQPF